jgi:DNA-binding response OmpR family regulator
VLTAADADEAIRVSDAHAAAIHLMVTDVVMPGRMNGRDLARLLSSRRPDMRVLYMSGYAENAIVHHGVLDAGVAFLPKPFNPSTLVAKVQAVLREPPRP